jgi:hypothetical protein
MSMTTTRAIGANAAEQLLDQLTGAVGIDDADDWKLVIARSNCASVMRRSQSSRRAVRFCRRCHELASAEGATSSRLNSIAASIGRVAR